MDSTVMPTTYLKRVAQLLDEEPDAMVDKALHIHALTAQIRKC